MEEKHQVKHHKVKPLTLEERDVLIAQHLADVRVQRKSSFCRFYLRGLCIFTSEECPFAHSIAQLRLKRYQGQEYEVDYKGTDFNQRPLFLQKRNYLNLTAYLPIIRLRDPTFPDYTPQQINDEKDPKARKAIRGLLHQDLYQGFLRYLNELYPGALWTDSFLEREYTRAGFNKTMTRIKFGFLQKYVQKKYFTYTFAMPPCLKKKTTFLLPKPAPEVATAFYDNCVCEFILSCKQEPAKFIEIRKMLFSEGCFGIPSFHQYLKYINLQCKEYVEMACQRLEDRLGRKLVVQYEDTSDLVERVVKKVMELKQSVVNWGQIKQIVNKIREGSTNSKVTKLKDLTKDVLYGLIGEGVIVFYHNSFSIAYFPMFAKDYLGYQHCCECQLSKKPRKQIVRPEGFEWQKRKIVLVDSEESLKYSEGAMAGNENVGVDLQGWLSPDERGYLQLVQVGVKAGEDTQVLVFDFIELERKGLKSEADAILKAVMEDYRVLKVFHDSRNDSLALHRFVGTCVINVFDTSICHILIQQQKQYPLKDRKQYEEMQVIRHPGLNTILASYDAPHGINSLKDKYHKLFGERKDFTARPIDPQYLQYSARDAEDLVAVQNTMARLIDRRVASLASALFAAQGHEALRPK